MASIGYPPDPKDNPTKSLKWKNFCGAAILNKNTLITAAHCFKDKQQNSKFKILVGDSNINDTSDDWFKAIYDIDGEPIKHPKYKADEVYYDVALIHTTIDIPFNNGVKPVCLPQSSIQNPDSR